MTRDLNAVIWLEAAFAVMLLVAATPAGSDDLRWNVRLYANSTDRIEVLVDTTASPDNAIVEQAELDVQFFDASGNPLGTRKFALLDDRIRALTAGHVYGLQFLHGHPGTRRVSSAELRYVVRAGGSKADAVSSQAASAGPGGITRNPDISVGTVMQPVTIAAIIPGKIVVKAVDPTIRRCRVYSDMAVAQNEANIGNRCGRTGPMWSSKYGYHFDWCLYAPAQQTRDGTAARQRELDQCAP